MKLPQVRWKSFQMAMGLRDDDNIAINASETTLSGLLY